MERPAILLVIDADAQRSQLNPNVFCLVHFGEFVQQRVDEQREPVEFRVRAGGLRLVIDRRDLA
jgi:hypothetical protein